MFNKTHLRRMTDNFRRPLTCADGGRRVIILRRTYRMLFNIGVYCYLNPIHWGLCPLGLSGCGIAPLQALMYPKATSAALSGKTKGIEECRTHWKTRRRNILDRDASAWWR
jgi:hypothetical protein